MVLSVLGIYCLSSAIKVDSRCLVSRDLHDALVQDIPLPPRWAWPGAAGQEETRK
jgi:hypothetical protein